jgi:hypothetical protein
MVEASVSRFFFDIVASQTRLYDFHGQFLVNRVEAERFAELVVLDCSVSDDEDWTDGEVQVRDEGGSCVLRLPIRPAISQLVA